MYKSMLEVMVAWVSWTLKRRKGENSWKDLGGVRFRCRVGGMDVTRENLLFSQDSQPQSPVCVGIRVFFKTSLSMYIIQKKMMSFFL